MQDKKYKNTKSKAEEEIEDILKRILAEIKVFGEEEQTQLAKKFEDLSKLPVFKELNSIEEDLIKLKNERNDHEDNSQQIQELEDKIENVRKQIENAFPELENLFKLNKQFYFLGKFLKKIEDDKELEEAATVQPEPSFELEKAAINRVEIGAHEIDTLLVLLEPQLKDNDIETYNSRIAHCDKLSKQLRSLEINRYNSLVGLLNTLSQFFQHEKQIIQRQSLKKICSDYLGHLLDLEEERTYQHIEATNKLLKLITEDEFSVVKFQNLYAQLRPTFDKTVDLKTIVFQQEISKLIELKSKTVAVIDADMTIFKDAGGSITLEALLSTLEKQGLTDIYLFTNSAITKESIEKITAIKEELSKKGFNVRATLNPADFIKKAGGFSVKNIPPLESLLGRAKPNERNPMVIGSGYKNASENAMKISQDVKKALDAKVQKKSDQRKINSAAYFFHYISSNLPPDITTCVFICENKETLEGAKKLNNSHPLVELMTLQVKPGITEEKLARRLYQQTRALLETTIKEGVPSIFTDKDKQGVREKAEAVIKKADSLARTASVSELHQLTDILMKEQRLLRDPSPSNQEAFIAAAEAAKHKSSLGWKVLGGAMISLGVVLIGAGLATIPAFGIGTVVGGGMATAGLGLVVGGLSFFDSKDKVKDLQIKADELQKAIKPPSKS